MASPVSLLSRLVAPRAGEVSPCLVCGRAVRADGDRMRLRGGGYVHLDCATYRMRTGGARHVRRTSARGGRALGGD